MNKLVALALAVVAGISVATQQLLNAQLRRDLNSAAWSGFVSYFVGTLCMVGLAVVLRDRLPPVSVVARAPWWAWTGGCFGATFIALAIYLVPQLGAATFFALLIAGQVLGSLVFDHFGLFGLAPRPVDLPRLVGAGLLIAGVVCIRR